MLLAKAIPTNEKNVRGAVSNIEIFLPSLFAKLAARRAPKTAPASGATAHHDPSVAVVGIEEEFDSRYGR